MAEAQSALHLALSTKNASAMVAAIKLRAQLNNLLVERREVTKPEECSVEELERDLIERIVLAGFTREQAELIVREGADPKTVAKPH